MIAVMIEGIEDAVSGGSDTPSCGSVEMGSGAEVVEPTGVDAIGSETPDDTTLEVS